MTWAVGIVIAVTLVVIVHLLTLTFPREEHLESDAARDKTIDLR